MIASKAYGGNYYFMNLYSYYWLYLCTCMCICYPCFLQVCLGKGFVCEFCCSPEIIFPFELSKISMCQSEYTCVCMNTHAGWFTSVQKYFAHSYMTLRVSPRNQMIWVQISVSLGSVSLLLPLSTCHVLIDNYGILFPSWSCKLL